MQWQNCQLTKSMSREIILHVLACWHFCSKLDCVWGRYYTFCEFEGPWDVHFSNCSRIRTDLFMNSRVLPKICVYVATMVWTGRPRYLLLYIYASTGECSEGLKLRSVCIGGHKFPSWSFQIQAWSIPYPQQRQTINTLVSRYLEQQHNWTKYTFSQIVKRHRPPQTLLNVLSYTIY